MLFFFFFGVYYIDLVNVGIPEDAFRLNRKSVRLETQLSKKQQKPILKSGNKSMLTLKKKKKYFSWKSLRKKNLIVPVKKTVTT